MRLSIPPLLPPYGVLVLVVAYAIGALWLGLTRLDAIAQLTDAMTRSRATIDDLRAFESAVNEIDAIGPVGAPMSADALAASFERERRRIPVLLSAVRDKVRDDPAELALIEELVPLIAERTMLAASSIERKRSVADAANEGPGDRSGRKPVDRISAIIASLKSRELRELERGRETAIRAIAEARRDLYIMAGVTLLLVMALFLAVRRLRSFIAFVPTGGESAAVATASADSSGASDAGVGTLLRDAMLRARLAETAVPGSSGSGEHLRSLTAAIEQALSAGAAAFGNDPIQIDAQGVVGALTRLVQVYSRPEGLAIRTTIDQRARIRDPQKGFLVFRSAEWALEAIALRKRTGNVTLDLAVSEARVLLRIHALTDNPKLPVTFTPKESEEAGALRQGVTVFGGTFVVGEGPTGFSLTLAIPADA